MKRSQKPPEPRLNAYSYYSSGRPKSGVRKTSVRSSMSPLRIFRGLRSRLSLFRVVIIILLLGVIGVLISVDTTPIIRINKDVSPRSDLVYRDEIKSIIESSLLNRTKLTFDYQKVESRIVELFPEAEYTSISFDIFGRKPVVKLHIHSPAYTFTSKGMVWVLDDRGIAIARAEDVEDSMLLNLKPIIDEIGLETGVGKGLLSPGETKFLNQVIAMLEKQQAIVSQVFIPTVPKELDLVIRGETWRYKLNSEEQASEQAGSVLAARQSLLSSGSTPSEYVDLRAGEKVYWR